MFSIELPIVLPIVLPIGPVFPIVPVGRRVLGRTGLVGQGSWAGPAWLWLGGPRVLGRTGLGLAWGAKGPGPDRLWFGLGGRGSWAGPVWVWLGGPRVLGRTGLVLACGTKGLVPGRLGSSYLEEP